MRGVTVLDARRFGGRIQPPEGRIQPPEGRIRRTLRSSASSSRRAGALRGFSKVLSMPKTDSLF
eukprot:1346834-Pyramimonas_sp.AAC.1